MSKRSICLAAASVLTLSLCACGGGGGGEGVASIPPPPPPPTPTPTPTPGPAAVTIFGNPSPGEFATAGASISGPGGNLDTYQHATDRFGTVSGADQDQPHIRYNGGGYYEIEMPGSNWDQLIPYKGLVDPGPDNNYFQPQSVAQNLGYLATYNSRLTGYSYSELGGWGSAAAGRWGWVAFGTPTPAGGVPVSGSATYSGIVHGSADVMTPDGLYGGFDTTPINGTVGLNFDFAKGTLDGSMTVSLNATDLGTFNFKDTVFSVGSTDYSGVFDTSVAGSNFFLGKFTGPNAQETIGAWALPFHFSGDNQDHQAFGAWIAKKP